MDGGLTAIQCKCYDPNRTLYKSDLDSFLAYAHPDIDEKLVVSTTANWSNNLIDTIKDQRPPVQRLDMFGLEATSIDWDAHLEDEAAPLEPRARKALRPHQEAALHDVYAGFAAHDRGKLIMACGTGKTLTALRGAEQIAGPGGYVLFAAPSISLVAQAFREWNADSEIPIRSFAVCSDPGVGRGMDSDGAHLYDLPIPATTDPEKLANEAAIDEPDKLTVVFSTYQSMSVIRDAQAAGMPQFDLAVCDEAHRTTGYALKGEEKSNFLLIHDAEAIRARKRLYMTATPRIYDPKAKTKAERADVYLASMDDQVTYGTDFHELNFAEAVEKDLLSDYKVAILVIDKEQIASDYVPESSAEDEGLRVDDIGRVIGCLNGLAKIDPEGATFRDDTAPMRQAVAFSNRISDSKNFVDLVRRLQTEEDKKRRGLSVEARHIDGSDGVLKRTSEIAWLGAQTMVLDQQCRILSNARCLTEGIDVPALDAVLFLRPRKSQIDVVQAVGRVMRRADNKMYGYIILPIVVSVNDDPAEQLDRNLSYAHVWEVLQALRSHDERFEALVNQLDLNRNKGGRINVIGVGSRDPESEDESDGTAVAQQVGQAMFADFDSRIEQWREAIYAKIVERCGERRYWEQWADSVSDIARRHHTRITEIINQPGGAGEQFHEFVDALRGNLNESISDDDAAGMLSQHLITKPVFDALFGSSKFAELNPVSQAMQTMIDALADKGLEAETEELNDFYASVRRRAEGIDNAEGRQRIAIELYDNFFRKAFPRDAERLGIVYTPVEIVDFIIRSVEDLLQQEFGASLSDEGVHVLDPFTGTGTFIARLIQSGFIKPEDLSRKYREEIHANEIMLLAYYIAAVNIENSYHEAMREAGRDDDYEPFGGIVLTDTFQSSEPLDRQDTTLLPRNNERIERQLALDIRVILGNPPWSTGQRRHEDDNQNQRYSRLDEAIAETYVKTAAPGLKQGVYDSYVRSIRWASDRVLARPNGGIVAFVTNNRFIEGKAFDGFRKTLAKEFDSLHLYNLRGYQRGVIQEQSRLEGGKVFDSGSRAGVVVILLVKRAYPAAMKDDAGIRYRDIGDALSRDHKLEKIASSSLSDDDWRSIVPNQHGDWINQRNEHFLALRPLANIRSQPAGAAPIFGLSSNGLITKRDAWVFHSSRSDLLDRVKIQIKHFNDLVHNPLSQQEQTGDNPKRFKWDDRTERLAKRGDEIQFDQSALRVAAYRPFFAQHLYFDRALNNNAFRLPRVFSTPDRRVPVIVAEGGLRAAGRLPTVLATNAIPDVHLAPDGCHVFPRYVDESQHDGHQGAFLDGGHDNVTNDALAACQARYGDSATKDHIFAYVYGILHSPDYRQRYATDLIKMLPRISEVASADDFFAFAEAGQRLLDLHIGYEEVEPYELNEQVAFGAPEGDARWRVEKMKWAGNRKEPDRSTIIVNDWVTLSGIPDEAHRYVVGPRTALEWLIDRYRIRVDKASGIVNDVNDWGLELDPPNPRYIIDLIKRVTTVSVETMKIVDNLSPLREAE
jgi:predicted helicase